jgi:hypothetical protein
LLESPLPRPLPPPERHWGGMNLFIGGGRGVVLFLHFPRRRQASVLLSRQRRAILLASLQDALRKRHILRLIHANSANLAPFGSETHVSLDRSAGDERSVRSKTTASPQGTNMNSPGSRGGWVTAVTRRATRGGKQPGGTNPESLKPASPESNPLGRS